jgi:hypothetical protein
MAISNRELEVDLPNLLASIPMRSFSTSHCNRPSYFSISRQCYMMLVLKVRTYLKCLAVSDCTCSILSAKAAGKLTRKIVLDLGVILMPTLCLIVSQSVEM